MRVLITGVAGFLGSHVAHRLASHDHDVLGVDLIHPQDAWRVIDLIDSHKLDYSWASLQDISPLLKHCDTVIHCAAITDVAMASRSPLYASQINIQGTASLMEAAYTEQKQVIIISTHSVYGAPDTQGAIFTEDSPLRPSNFYGATKSAEELLAMSYARQYGLPVTTLRMVLMYGERERSGALVSSFIKRALRGDVLRLDGGGEQTRDLLYASDAVDAIELCLQDKRTRGQVYNVSTGQEISIKQLARMSVDFASRHTDTPGYMVPAPARAGEEGRLIVSSEKIRGLGWLPLYQFEDGFERTAEWVRESMGSLQRL